MRVSNSYTGNRDAKKTQNVGVEFSVQSIVDSAEGEANVIQLSPANGRFNLFRYIDVTTAMAGPVNKISSVSVPKIGVGTVTCTISIIDTDSRFVKTLVFGAEQVQYSETIMINVRKGNVILVNLKGVKGKCGITLSGRTVLVSELASELTVKPEPNSAEIADEKNVN